MTLKEAIQKSAYIVCENKEQRNQIADMLVGEGMEKDTIDVDASGLIISTGADVYFWFTTGPVGQNRVNASIFLPATTTDPVQAFLDIVGTLPADKRIAVLDAAYAMSEHHVKQYMALMGPLREMSQTSGQIRDSFTGEPPLTC